MALSLSSITFIFFKINPELKMSELKMSVIKLTVAGLTSKP